MSIVEKAIVADPANGIEGAVVLLDESDRNDVTGRFSRHIRAKILSDAGLSLAELRVAPRLKGRIVRFWGRTIAPDGRVSELRREELQTSNRWTTTVREVRPGYSGAMINSRNFDADFSVLHGTLHDVAPGSVIDYGWTVEGRSFSPYERTPLQGAFVVRKLRHRWVAGRGLSSGVRIPNDPTHRVRVEMKADAALITAENLPADSGEPLGPSPTAYLASEVIYYIPPGLRVDNYWEAIGAEIETDARAFVGDAGALSQLLESAGLNASEDFADKLCHIRSWLLATLTERKSLRTEAFPKTLAEAILRHEASGEQLVFSFVAIARAFDAEVEIVRVRSRPGGPWHPEILSTAELDNLLLRARRPGAPDADAIWIDFEPDVPCGEVGPEAQGARGIASRADTRRIELPVAPSSANSAETTATISPGASGGGSVRWVTTSRGGKALALRRELRQASADQRAATIATWCSGNPDQPVVTSEVSGDDNPDAPLEVRCGIGHEDVEGTASDAVVAVPLEGPWLAKLPILPPGPRRLPVILPFASRESAVIDVAAPLGRVAGDVPAGLRFSGPFGTYELIVERHGDGFRASRTLTMDVIEVQPADCTAFRGFIEDVREADQMTLPFGGN